MKQNKCLFNYLWKLHLSDTNAKVNTWFRSHNKPFDYVSSITYYRLNSAKQKKLE